MKIYLCRFLFAAWLGFVVSYSAATAQPNIKSAKNSAGSLKQTQPPTAKINLSTLEAAVVAEINQARNDPQKFVAYLEEIRKHTNGKLLSLPNKTVLQMIEGLPAIEDAISDLKKRTKINSFEFSGGLSKVARGQLKDLQENPTLKHFGKDGSDLEKRLMKVGSSSGAVAENISYQAETAREIVLNMLIDDGIKAARTGKNIFSRTFKLFGIACGAAKDKTTLCVAEFADSFKER